VTIVLVFQGQSARLVSDAPAYGWNWDLTVGSPGLGNFGEFVVDALADYPGIDGMAIGTVTNVEVNGRRVDALAVDDVAGSVVPTIRAGRAPQRDGEIALGSVALTNIEAGVGDDVDVAVGSLSERFEVVGEVVTPTLGDQGRLGSGAFMTASSLARLVPGLAANVVLVDLASTADAASLENLRLAFAPIPTRDATNGDELGFTDAAPTDTLVVIAAVIALAIVANIVSMSVRRRHRELAVVRALGLTRAQARHVIHAEAITTAVVALLIGLPLGAAVGRVGWDAFLDTLGVDGPDGLDWQRLGKLAIVIVVLTTIFSLVPARLATNDSPADRLRGR
jgi:hypothetical protein